MTDGRGPMDFYHQHMWKFTSPQSEGMESSWGCTRCGELFDSYDAVIDHCDDADCDRTDTIDWLEALKP